MTHKWRVILILFSFSMWLGGVVNAAPPAKKVVVQEPLDVSVINAPVVVPAPPADQLPGLQQRRLKEQAGGCRCDTK